QHKVRPLEGLVSRRRLVDTPSDRLEVVNAEGIRIEVAVPADEVERVVVEGVGHDLAVDLDADLVLAALVVQRQLARPTQVAVAIWRMLQELAELVPVALGRLDRAAEALNHEEPLLIAGRRGAPRSAAWNHQIVAFVVRQRAECGLQRALTEVD